MGFQHMTKERLREVARKGGTTGGESKHRFTSEEGRAAGKKGRRGPDARPRKRKGTAE